MKYWTVLKAIFSRLLFFAHGISAVYMYNQKKNDANYWFLLTPLLFLLIESFITIIYKKGLDYKYVWPSGLFYITCIIPVIWLIELDLHEAQIIKQKTELERLNYNSLTSTDQQKAKRQILVYAIDISKRSKNLKKICELGLMICIIICRWLMPRGTLTKDQLSALLLVYVGNSADILELFDTFEEPEVSENKPVIIAVMAVFTWSMYQFTMVTTATIKGDIEASNIDMFNTRKIRVKPATVHTGNELKNNIVLRNDYICDIRTKARNTFTRSCDKRGRGKKITSVSLTEKVPINEEASEEKEEVIKQREVHGELYQILVTLLMQDGPFLILRLYLLIHLNVASEMHIFFTCKNAIVSLLLVYRLLILSCSGKDEAVMLDREDATTKLHNIQLAMELQEMKDYDLTNILVK